jgi:23S rRNA pseudouridine1911/1915/1917 synthase
VTSRLERTVPSAAAGKRVDTWLAETLGESSRALAQRLIEAGQVEVDGQRPAKSLRLRGGERVSATIELPGPERDAAQPAPRIVHEDASLLIVDKPAGLVVHPAPGHRSETLIELLRRRQATDLRVVHRLDRDTSGLMVVAKGEEPQARLQRALGRREVEREYVALVKGRLGSRAGTIEAPLGRHPVRRTRMSTRTERPREARTHFAVERFVDGYTLLRARLETGRTHQIRAHFAGIGHPVCGDREYGGRGLLGLERQFLHSARLALPHPETGARLEWTSELPDDLRAALSKLTG